MSARNESVEALRESTEAEAAPREHAALHAAHNSGTRLTCPDCGGAEVHRSRRGGLDWLLSLTTGKRPFRCHTCNHRFWSRRASVRWAETS